MKIKELIEALKAYNEELEIILQKDSEGNGYIKLYSADIVLSEDEITYYTNSVYNPHWSADDADMTKEEWADFKKTAHKYLVLAP